MRRWQICRRDWRDRVRDLHIWTLLHGGSGSGATVSFWYARQHFAYSHGKRERLRHVRCGDILSGGIFKRIAMLARIIRPVPWTRYVQPLSSRHVHVRLGQHGVSQLHGGIPMRRGQ